MQQIQYPFRTEHDVVIALIEDFNSAVTDFNKQMLDFGNDQLAIKRMLESHFAQIDKRLTAVEDSMKELDPKEIAKTVRENAQWIRDYNRGKHFAWVVASTVFIIIGYLISYLKIINK